MLEIDPTDHDVTANNHGGWFYDVEEDKAVIVIDKTAPLEKKRYILLHELLHAVHELLDVGISEFPEHVQPTKAEKSPTPISG